MKIIRRLILSLCLLAALPAACLAGVSNFITEPWNLALVIDGSARLDRPWVRVTPRQGLAGALQTEIHSLPVRVTAAVWLSNKKGVKNLVPPTASADLKGKGLFLPPGQGGPDLRPGAAAAMAWLRASGGGSLLMISAGGGPMTLPPADIFRGQNGIYCHALGIGDIPPELGGLAMAGGGGVRLVPKPNKLRLFLHAAVRDAISPANLLVNAADSENKPQLAVYHITRKGVRAEPRPAYTGRKVQLAAGDYGLAWPDKKAIGPGAPPAHARIGLEGTTELWAGGSAELGIKSLGPTKSNLPWRVKVSRIRDGKMVSPYRQVPFKLPLPTGRYLVGSLAPAMTWKVNLAAGQKLTLGVGLYGGLKAQMRGPGGPARVEFEATALLEDRKPYAGHTGYRLRLAPGPYMLKFMTIPPLFRKVDIKPEKVHVMKFPPVGKLEIRDPRGKHMRYMLFDTQKRLLSEGKGGGLLFLQPGDYLVKTAGLNQLFKVSVKAEMVTTLQTPAPKP